MTEKNRAAFEVWAQAAGYFDTVSLRRDGTYVSALTQDGWAAYQAGFAAGQQAETDKGKELKYWPLCTKCGAPLIYTAVAPVHGAEMVWCCTACVELGSVSGQVADATGTPV